MELLVKQLIDNQFQASLSTLAFSVEKCPDSDWNLQVAKYPFCQVAFHTLFFADYYLSPDAETFRTQSFHLANTELFAGYEQLEDREPTSVYTRVQIRTYLKFCREKAKTAIAAETEASLSAPARFARRNFTRAELYVYNMRHIQHHAAQLVLRLRLNTDIDIPWIGSGWREPV